MSHTPVRSTTRAPRSPRFVAPTLLFVTTAVVALLEAPLVARVGAQVPERRSELPACTALAGNVVDADGMRPITGATVVLTRDARDSTDTTPATCVSAITEARTMVTGEPGRYRFDGLAPGQYTVRVQRLGYRLTTLTVVLHATADARLSVGLTELPVVLHPIAVRGDSEDSYGRRSTVGAGGSAARLAAAATRADRLLASDAREITHADVEQATTLGETDVLRAAQRLSGVASRDEYSARLWARGARWDQTRVTLDGLPLFDATHAFGAFSAVNTDALGSAVLHLGMRSAAIAEGGSAVLDLQTRRAAPDGALRGLGELTPVSARVALDQGARDGRTAWMLAARRSYLDLGSWAAERLAGIDKVFVPYYFSDLIARGDQQVGNGMLEASGLYATDGLTGDVPQLVHRNRARRTNAMGRVALSYPLRGIEARLTAGVSDLSASIRQRAPDDDIEWIGVRTEPPMRSGIRYSMVGAAVGSRVSEDAIGWSLGAELVSQRARFTGPAQRTFAGDLSLEPTTVDRDLAQSAVWGELRLRARHRAELTLGTRAEFGDSLMNGGTGRIAPRAQGRLWIGRATSLSLGAGRVFQYSQAIPPAGGLGRDGVLYPTDLWVVADETLPALRADIATFGVERRWGTEASGWIATANLFARSENGLVLGDPTPGPRVDTPLFVTGTDRTRGWEVGLRRIGEWWSGEAAYSVTDAQTTVGSVRFPSPYHRPHAIDVAVQAKLTQALRANAAFTAGSGIAYARVTPAPTMLGANDETEWTGPAVVEAPGAHRSAAFRNADVGITWRRSAGRLALETSLQLHNVFGRRGSGIYDGYVCRRLVDASGVDTPDTCLRRGDRFAAGLPLVPSFAFRVGF